MKVVCSKYSAELLSGINNLRTQSELCDVMLKVENCVLPAHKIVLSAGCPYFNAMFNGSFPEKEQKEVTIHGISSELFLQMLDFLYTGHIELTSDNALGALSTACFFQIKWIQDQCCEFLVQIIDVKNCLKIKNYADRFSCEKLRKKSMEYIIEHFDRIYLTQDFLALDLLELEEILHNDLLYDIGEDIAFKSVLRWIQDDANDRASYLSYLLKFIHPLLVSKNLIDSSEMLRMQPDCIEWTSQANGLYSTSEWEVFILDKTGKDNNLYQYQPKKHEIFKLDGLPEKLFGVNVCGAGHFLFAQGGLCGRRTTSDCFQYNIPRKRWSSFKSLMVPRSHHSCCILNESIYTIGGTGINGAINTVEYLDISTKQQKLIASMQKERSSMGAVVHESSLYVMGGENELESIHSMEKYDPREGIWTEMASMTKVKSYCSSATIGNCIYCAEGLAPYMECYDVRSNKWELVKFKKTKEFYQLFAMENNLFGLAEQGIFKYNSSVGWEAVYLFKDQRDWDAAVPLNVEILKNIT